LALNERQQAFVKAYLGSAQGNATKAAITAGYSERSAHVQGCELLKHPNITEALHKSADRAGLTIDRMMTKLEDIIESPVKDIRASDQIKAIELGLKVKGALKDKQTDARITVNIGYLNHTPEPLTIDVQVTGPEPTN